jgi:catechol 2,3-dioxygenase-like lactoylglutathione lyase family enzyme
VAVPIFPVRDLEEACAFWKSAGLDIREYDDGYAFVLADGHEFVHLALEPSVDPERNLAACYIHVVEVEEWHDRLSAAGLPVTPLRDEPWRMREFSVRDPSGNRLRVGRPL